MDAVQKQNAGFGKVVGRTHDGVPDLLGGHFLVNPQTVFTLVGTGFNALKAGAGAVHQLPALLVRERMHEGVGHGHRHVEVVPAPGRALGAYELKNIGMVNAQHAHLGAPARASALDRGAGMVKHIDVAARS